MSKIDFKGRKDGIMISIEGDESFEEIKKSLAEKAIKVKNMFGKKETPLYFKGKDFTDSEMQELTGVIEENTNLDITYVADEIYINKYIKNDDKNKKNIEKKPTKVDIIKEKIINHKENAENNLEEILNVGNDVNTVYIQKGNMRSGHLIEHDGTVVVYGTMNAGSEIKASGNIIVLGTVRGLVHAGYKGDKECTVFALGLEPIQLRIADLITYIPKDKVKKDKAKKDKKPSYAYVEKNKIFIKEFK